jgi:hypothetical protein
LFWLTTTLNLVVHTTSSPLAVVTLSARLALLQVAFRFGAFTLLIRIIGTTGDRSVIVLFFAVSFRRRLGTSAGLFDDK